MALNASGPISLAGTTTGQSIEIELAGNGTTQISLNDAAVRGLAGVPSGAIIMPTNFWGKSNSVNKGIYLRGDTTCSLYDYANDTTAAGPTQTSPGSWKTQAFGNTTVAICPLGNSSFTTQAYSWSANSFSAATSLSGSNLYGGATSISEYGIVWAGSYGSTDTTDKYTFSGNTVTPQTAIGSFSPNASAQGNSTVGVFLFGHSQIGTFVWTYASSSSVAGTDMPASYSNGSTTSYGNNTNGYFVRAGSTLTNKYTYSNNTTSASTALTTAAGSGAGAGNSTFAIIAIDSSTATTNKFTFSSSTIAVATALSAVMASGCSAASGNPGNL